MESGRSDLARAAGEASAAIDPDLEASAGAGKGKIKNRASSEVLILASDEGPQAAGEQKTKIQSTPTVGEHSSGKIAGGQQEQIEGLDWDDDKLAKEIDGYLQRLKDAPLVDQDDESFYLDEEQHRALNRRLALRRIRAHDDQDKYQDMDDETLSELFPPSDLEANEYYKFYERGLEWYFDPTYCWYAHFQDYQRLVLRNNGGYQDWERCRMICSTLEGDQEFLRFWEELSTKTELAEWYMTRTSHDPRIGRLFHYHVLKVAAGYPNLSLALVDTGFLEFRHGVQIDFTWYRDYADFLFEVWRLLTREKMSFQDALSRVYNSDDHRYSFMFPCPEFEQNLRLFKELYKPLLDRIGDERADEADVKGLIMDFFKGSPGKPKIYYDYAKNKLSIAKKIGIIP